jgi:hypothetical protein
MANPPRNLKAGESFDVPAPEAGEAQAQPFIAQRDTMTVYGQTVDEIITGMREDVQRFKEEAEAAGATIIALNETITAKNAKIDELVEYSKKKNETISELRIDLGVARMLKYQGKAGIPVGLERLPGGGIRLGVTLDVDEATPLLSWADGAGEDPAEYIAKQVKDALVAVTSS